MSTISTVPRISTAEENKLFLEFACQQGKLSPEAANFCRERMESGMSPSAIAVSENFMTPESVAEIYGMIYKDQMPKEGEKGGICIVTPNVTEETSADDFEKKLEDYIRQKGLLDETAWRFCHRELKRLRKMGHNVSLASVLFGSSYIKPAMLTEIYQALLGNDAKICMVERSTPFVESGIPEIRKKPRSKRAKKEANIMENLGEVLQKADRKKTKKTATKVKKQKTSAPAEETEEYIEIEESAEDMRVSRSPKNQTEQNVIPGETCDIERMDAASYTAYQNRLMSAISAMGMFFKNLSPEAMQIIQNTLIKQAAAAPLTTQTSPTETPSQKASVPEKKLATKHDKEQEEEPGEEQNEEREISQAKKGKTRISADKALKTIENGGTLESCYIPSLQLSQATLPGKIVLTDCVIENLDLSDVIFQNTVDFQGSQFIGKAVFKGSTFQKDAQFSNTTFVDGADFTKTVFEGDVRFNTTQFKRFVTFNRAQCKQKAIFTRSYFAKGAKFAEVEFAMGASFNDIYCDHRFYMEKCNFLEESTFSNAKFSEIAEFSNSSFQKPIKFKGTSFAKWVSFQSVKFESECHFNNANIAGDISFQWASFQGLINLQALCAERNVNFKNSKVGDAAAFSFFDAYLGRLMITRDILENHLDSHIQKDYKKARQEYGLLKNNFREINEYEMEDWAYLMEKRMERFAITVTGPRTGLARFLNWIALDVSCGYGTKPLNILAASLSLLLLFAAIYYIFGGILGGHFHPPSTQEGVFSLPFLQSILISFRTFTNGNIGGWEPTETSFINYIMMIESFCGLFVMAVLVVTFSRKVIR